MKKIKNYAPELFKLTFWVHAAMTVIIFIAVPVGAKIIFYGSIEDVGANISESDCAYRVSRSGNIYSKNSPIYSAVTFKTGLCYEEAQIISKILR